MKIGNKILPLVNINFMHRTMTLLLFSKIFSIKCEEITVLWEATLIWSWTFRRIKKEEMRQRIEIRLKKSRT